MKVDEMEGVWVRRGMIWRSTAPRPADEPDPEHVILANLKYRCGDCGDPVSRAGVKRCLPCDRKNRASKARTGWRPPTLPCPDCDGQRSRTAVRCKECDTARRQPANIAPPSLTDEQLMARIGRNIARLPTLDYRPLTGVVCAACGCLCAADEDCPGCRVWAREREAEKNRRHKHDDLWMEAA